MFYIDIDTYDFWYAVNIIISYSISWVASVFTYFSQNKWFISVYITEDTIIIIIFYFMMRIFHISCMQMDTRKSWTKFKNLYGAPLKSME